MSRRHQTGTRLAPGNPKKWLATTILHLCRQHGQTLRLTHGSRGRPETYELSPAGIVLDPTEAARAVASGALATQDAGLFPGHAQSWAAR
jgi:hypothetical protein